MNKNEWIAPVLIIGLSCIFAQVSAMVYLSKGKSEYWISRKLRVGAFLLTLTAISTQSCEDAVRTCYDPAPGNYFKFDSTEVDIGVVVDMSRTNWVTGILYDRTFADYCFSVTDTAGTDTLQVGVVIPTDGKFNSSREQFIIELDRDLPGSLYYLHIFSGSNSMQSYQIGMYQLKVINENEAAGN
ncbi:MAG: hypothetical protein U0T82_11440 [Bacteroidales bacterium]